MASEIRHQHLREDTQLRLGENVTRRYRDTPPVTQNHGSSFAEEFIVPILPLPLAFTCCLINFAIPGLGTIIAGCCVPCCGDKEEMSKRRTCCSSLFVVGVGFLQLLLTACFLVGWIWSTIWGLSLIGTSLDYYQKDEDVPSSWRHRINSAGSGNSGCIGEPFRSGRRRRPRSNFIYPMRAPSDVERDSPPPPYVMYSSPPPGYTPRTIQVQEETAEQTNTADSEQILNQTETQPVNSGTARTYSRCSICQINFDARAKKYLCRRCTETVCVRCYTKTFEFQGGGTYVVCDICYDELTQEQREHRELENG